MRVLKNTFDYNKATKIPAFLYEQAEPVRISTELDDLTESMNH